MLVYVSRRYSNQIQYHAQRALLYWICVTIWFTAFLNLYFTRNPSISPVRLNPQLPITGGAMKAWSKSSEDCLGILMRIA